MSDKLTSLEEFINKYISNQKVLNKADSFDTYKRKNAINYTRDFNKGAESLYATKMKELATYGRNNRNIANIGLQNSGYSEYVNNQANSSYNSGVNKLKQIRDAAQSDALRGYTKYLEKYSNRQTALKESVSSHLISNNVVNLNDAISYGIAQGLSEDDAIAIGQNAYSITKQKAFNSILEQATSLGLDREGAVMLAKKMGFTDEDAEEAGREVGEMMSHYQNVSQGYLDYLKYLEEKSSQTTQTFK